VAVKKDTEFQVSLKLKDEISAALKEVAKTASKTTGGLSNLQAAVISLNQGLALAQKAFRAFSGPLSMAADEFIAAEKSQRKLINALALNGQLSRSSLRAWSAYADEIKATTTVDDDQVASLIGKSKAMRLSDERTKKFIETSIALAEVTDGDVNGAFMTLTGTIAGRVSPELARLDPRLKNLTEQEKRAGVAADFLAERLGGLGKLGATSLDGLRRQAENAFGDFAESIGKLTLELLGGPELFTGTRRAFQELQSIVENTVRPAMLRAREVVLNFVDGVKTGLGAVDFRGLASQLKYFGGALLAIASPAIVGAIMTMAVAFAAWAAPLALIAATLALIAAKIIIIVGAATAVAAAVDIIVRNFEKLPQVSELFTNALAIGFGFIREQFLSLFSFILQKSSELILKMSEMFGNIPGVNKVLLKAQSVVGSIATSAAEEAKESADALALGMDELKTSAEGLDLGFIGKGFKEVQKFLSSFNKGLDEANNKAAQLSAALPSNMPTVAGGPEPLSAENLKALEELTSKMLGDRAELAQLTETERQAADVALRQRLDEVDALEQKLRLENQLDSLAQAKLNAARETAKALAEQKRDLLPETFRDLEDNFVASIGAAVDALEEGGLGAARAWAVALKDGARLALATFDSLFIKPTMALFEGAFSGDMALKPADFAAVTQAFREGAVEGVGAALTLLSQNAGAAVNQVVTAKPFEKLVTVLEGIKDWPAQVMRTFESLGRVVEQLVKSFPAMVARLLDKVPSIIQKVVESIPKIVDLVAKALPRVAHVLSDALVSAVGAVAQKLPDLLASIGDAAAIIFSKLPAIVDKLADNLAPLVEKFFQIVPKMADTLIRAVPEIIRHMADRIDEVVLAFVEGFIGAAGEIVASWIDAMLVRGGLERIIVALIKAIPRVAVAFVTGVVKGLVRAVKAIFGSIFGGFKMPRSLEELPGKIADGAKKLGKSLQREASKLFAVKDLDELAGGLDPMEDLKDLLFDIEVLFEEGGYNLWRKIMDAWNWVKENVLHPLLDGLAAVWTWAYERVVLPIVSGLRSVWLWAYTNVVGPIVNGLRQVWLWVYETLILPLATFVGDAFAPVIAFFSDAAGGLGKFVADAWKAVLDFFKDPKAGLSKMVADAWASVFEFFDTLKKKVDTAFAGVSDFGKKIWDGFKSMFDATIFTSWGTKIWDGLKSGLDTLETFFTDLFNKLNPSSLLAKVFKVDWPGGYNSDPGTVEKALGIDVPFIKFAQGGIVPGKAMTAGDHPMNDRILAMLSPGEAVIPRSAMAVPGMKALVDSVIAGDLSVARLWKASVSAGGVGVSVGSDGVSVDTKGSGQLGGVLGAIASGDLEGAASMIDPSNIPREMWDAVFGKVVDGMWKMLEKNRFADGGIVSGAGYGDTVPAMLTPGEFVVNRESTRRHLPKLQAINEGALSERGGGAIVIENITINPQTAVSAEDIRAKVVPAVKQAIKRASQDGEFVVHAAGVRK
jgi:hypothetical protein